MTGLEETFYIMSIIFMCVMFILIAALVVMVFVIRNKVVRIQHNIEEKINSVTAIAEKGGQLAALATGGVVGKARRALNKRK